jgi:hypothetical protein
MINLSKIEFIFKTNFEFNIPISVTVDEDDCSYHESECVTAMEGDIMFLSTNPEDSSLLILNCIENQNGITEYNYSSYLSIDFLKLNATKENNIFIEIPLKVYQRDLKIDYIID